MVQGQYQYPVSAEGSQDPEFKRGMYLSSDSPERIQPGKYLYIKRIEIGIERLRSTADEATVARYGVGRFFQPITSLFIAPPTTESTEKKLVNAESEIGGRQLSKES